MTVRTPVQFVGGLKPAEPWRPALTLTEFVDTTRVVPDHAKQRDWLQAVTDYPMFGNDKYGDCVFAGQAHEIMALRAAAGLPPLPLTDDLVLGQYSAVTGFRKNDPNTDQGAVMQEALDYWRRNGFAGLDRGLRLFAKVDYRDPQQVAASIDLFGSVSLGVTITQTAMDQFNAGEPWDLVVGQGDTLGRHAIHGGWYDLALGKWKVVTWGQVQTVTQRWFDAYVGEAWAKLMDADWAVGGKTPEGLDLYGLGQGFSQLTGQTNPFAPTPPPVDPTPRPIGVDEADQELWSGLLHWMSERHIGDNHDAQSKVAKWSTRKNLHY